MHNSVIAPFSLSVRLGLSVYIDTLQCVGKRYNIYIGGMGAPIQCILSMGCLDFPPSSMPLNILLIAYNWLLPLNNNYLNLLIFMELKDRYQCVYPIL